MVRLSLALLIGFAVPGALSGRADDVLPPYFNFDRYSRMLDHSPFAVATALALPEAMPDFAKDLYVANAARSSEGDMATIVSSSDQKFKKYLTTKEPVDGYSIASIEWSQKAGETKVTIGKDGKFATLTFNQALMSQSAPSSARIAQNVPLIPSSVPGQASRGRARDTIQRNTKAVAAASTPMPMPDLEPPSPKQLEQQATAAAEQLQQQQRQKQQQQRIKLSGEP
jgi:hypothetical protein